MKCITLTLNPAFDRHCTVPRFSTGREHLVTVERCDAGGKGINISRALAAYGVESLALVVTGTENEKSFLAALEADGLHCLSLSVPGRIRENLTVHAEHTGETRISFSGFEASDALLDRVSAAIAPHLEADTVVTFTGRAPRGIGMEAMLAFLRALSDWGCRIVLDSRSFERLEDIVAAKPFLIKPNREELEAYLGREAIAPSELAAIAQQLHASGVENVMISLGGEGALLACSEGCLFAKAPDVEFRSAIGAGDSAIGGFLSASSEGASPEEALRRAVAFGSAACMRDGTLPPLARDIGDLLARIRVTRL